ncbi:MAG TPA: chitobiase/beta-hexosaminidase C-terminal domain-containing protein, partial [Acidobacteriaceae bacterium]
ASEYTAPIPVSKSETITAIAGATGYANSAVATATYTVTSLPAATPVFSPASGSYDTPQSVTISDATPGAAIYYTTDGSTPGTSSAVYQGPIKVSSSQIVQAIALANGVPNSAIGSAVYTVGSTSSLGDWAWMGGSGQKKQVGVYGNLGVPAAGNFPGARQGSTSWTDASGNLWLFGGAGFDSRGYFGYLNDLWKYNPSTQQWAWMGGSSLVPCNNGVTSFNCGGPPGVYGTLGIAAPANIPGGRSGAAAWTDSKGHVWLFGGEGVGAVLTGELNDLWEFDPSSNEWTWMGGSSEGTRSFYSSFGQPGVYGTLGVPAATNIPGSRFNAATWVDSQGNFWLFGGTGEDANGYSATLNDFWMFNPSTKEWVWMGGSNAIEVLVGYVRGAYGTLGVAAAGNSPGSRAGAAAWTDSNGKFWLFGGNGGSNTGYLNDLWKYDPSSNQWAWMAGASSPYCSPGSPGEVGSCPLRSAVYGALGIPAVGNTPGGGPVSASWTDQRGNFWLLGGNDADVTGQNGGTGNGTSNELWAFNPSSNEWAWMGGEYVGNCSWTVPVYFYAVCDGQLSGSLGVAAMGNIPAARVGAVSWTDKNGNFWLFSGGVGVTEITDYVGDVNDLWEYQPSIATLPPAATPIFTFKPEANQPAGVLTLANDMAGASIYYTTDGNTPTTASNLYSGPITVSSTETVKAMAADPGYRNSVVTSTAYTVYPPPATPTFSVAPGTYTSIQTVTIADATPNTTIYYTTDGTAPNASSLIYRGPITVSSSEIINALATAYGSFPGPQGTFPINALLSAVATAAYTIHLPQAATPALSVPSGTYTSAQTVTISDETAGATIYYTTNGTVPTTYSNVYKVPLNVAFSETIEAMAVAYDYTNSAVTSAAYTIVPVATTPMFAPAAGTYTSVQKVTIRDTTAGAVIHYTTDGTTPTTSSSVYTGPITISSSETIKAIAAATGYTTSAVASAAYTINLPMAAAPTFSPAAGTYTSAQTVTISDATAGAVIHYTTDGTTPTVSSSVYAGPITISSSETVEAIATAAGYTTSAVASAAYTINVPMAAAPTFSPAAGTYTSAQTVTISDATAGTVIHYTTDGTTPTVSSSVYVAPITVSSSGTVEAIATAAGYGTSPVGTAVYVINIPTNPALILGSMSPAFAPGGGAAFTLQITGSGFTSGSTVYWGSTALPTQLASGTQLTAQVQASAIATGGITTVTVQTPAGVTSNSLQFEVDSAPSGSITPPSFLPSAATISPGATATYAVTLPPTVTNVSASCLNLPSGASCSYSATNGTVMVTTSATIPAGTYEITVVFTETEPGAATAVLVLPMLLLPFLLARRRLASTHGFTACLGLTLLAAMACMSACGGGGGSGTRSTQPSTPTHQVTSSGVVRLTIQ